MAEQKTTMQKWNTLKAAANSGWMVTNHTGEGFFAYLIVKAGECEFSPVFKSLSALEEWIAAKLGL